MAVAVVLRDVRGADDSQGRFVERAIERLREALADPGFLRAVERADYTESRWTELHGQWRAGALMGQTEKAAFYVRCDRTTMTQNDIDNGRLVCEIGVAPVKPAEFVVIRIGLWTADRKP